MKTALLMDIGNTNTHLGIANDKKVILQTNIPTRAWKGDTAPLLKAFLGKHIPSAMVFCSVVPKVSPKAIQFATRTLGVESIQLTCRNVSGIGIDYPKPGTIGPDRLANAMAAKARFGAPVVVVDFGTAVTFDVVDPHSNYVGGIIAPGLSAMTDYLHDKTALLPRIRIKEVKRVVGKSTVEAMLIGAVHGYRGLVKELLAELKGHFHFPSLPVVFTGGYSSLIAKGLKGVSAVEPDLTLEGLRLLWKNQS